MIVPDFLVQIIMIYFFEHRFEQFLKFLKSMILRVLQRFYELLLFLITVNSMFYCGFVLKFKRKRKDFQIAPMMSLFELFHG